LAIETFSVELELELEEFTKNIKEARKELAKLDALDIKGPQFDSRKAKESAGAIDSVGGAIRGVASIIFKVGGLVAGLKLVRALFGGIVGDGGKVTKFLTQFGAQASFAASSSLGFTRNLIGANTGLGKFLGKVQTSTFFTGKLASSIKQLGAGPEVQNFAKGFVRTFDKIETATLNVIPGFRKFQQNFQTGVTGAFTMGQEAVNGHNDAVLRASQVNAQATKATGAFGAKVAKSTSPIVDQFGRTLNSAGESLEKNGVKAANAAARATAGFGKVAADVGENSAKVLGKGVEAAGAAAQAAGPAIKVAGKATEVTGQIMNKVGSPAVRLFGKATKFAAGLMDVTASSVSGLGTVTQGAGKATRAAGKTFGFFGKVVRGVGEVVRGPATLLDTTSEVFRNLGNEIQTTLPRFRAVGTGFKAIGTTAAIASNTITAPFKIAGNALKGFGLIQEVTGKVAGEVLGGGLEVAGTVAKDVAAPGLRLAAEGTRALGDVVEKVGPEIPRLVGKGIEKVGVATQKAGPAVKKFGGQVRKMGQEIFAASPALQGIAPRFTKFSENIQRKAGPALTNFGTRLKENGARLREWAKTARVSTKEGLRSVVPTTDQIKKKYAEVSNTIKTKAVPQFQNLKKRVTDTVSGFSFSAAGAGRLTTKLKDLSVRGLGAVGVRLQAATEGVKRFSATVRSGEGVAGKFNAGLSALSVGARKFATSAGVMSIALLGIDLALGLVGKILVSIGRKLTKFSRGIAEAAGKAELSFRKVGFALEQANEESGNTLGGIQDFEKQIRKLSKSTGFTIDQIADMTAKFLLMQPSIQLTREQLAGAIERTAILGASFNNLGRATIAVVDAFNKNFVPLRNLVGTELDAAKVKELSAKQSFLLEQANRGVANSTERAANSTVIYNEILRSTTPLLQTFNETTDVLTTATRRFNGALKNIAIDAGKQAQATLALLTNIATKFLGIIELLPTPIKAFTLQIVTVTGKLLIIIGTLLKLIALVVLVTNATRIFNLILSANIPKIGKLNTILGDTISKFTQTNIVIKNSGDAFKAFGALALISIQRLGDALGKLLIRITTFNFTLASTLVPVKKVGGALVGLTTFLAGVLFGFRKTGKAAAAAGTQLDLFQKPVAAVSRRALLLRSTLTKFFFLLGLGVDIIKRANKRFQVMEKVIKPLIKFLFDTTIIAEALARAGAFLGDVFEILGKTAFAVVVTAVVALLIVLQALSLGFEKLGKILSFIPGATGRIGKGMEEAGKAAKEFLGEAIAIGTRTIGDLAGESVDLALGLKDVARGAKDAAKETKKATATFEEFKEALDISRQSIEAVFKDSKADFDVRVQRIEELTLAQKRFAEITIKSEQDRLRVIGRINARSSVKLLGIAKERRDASLALIKRNQEFELGVLKNLEKQEKITFTDRVKRLNEITKETNDANREVLMSHLETLKQIGKKEQDLSDKRIALSIKTEREIRNDQKDTQRILRELEIEGLSDIKAAAARRIDAQKAINRFREASAKDDSEITKKARAEAKAAGNLLEGDAAKIRDSAAKANEAASSDDVNENRKRFAAINRAFFGRLPDAAKDAANKVNRALFAGLPATSEFAALATALEKAAGDSRLAARTRFFTQFEAIEEASRVRQAAKTEEEKKKAKTEREETLAAIQSTADKINELREEAKKPFDIIGKFVVDKESLEKLEDLKRRIGEPFKIPVEIEVPKGPALARAGGKISGELVKAIRQGGFAAITDDKDGFKGLEAAARKFDIPLGGFGKKRGVFGPGEEEAQAAAAKFTRQFRLATDEAFSNFRPKVIPEFVPPTETGGAAGLTRLVGGKPITVPVTPSVSPDAMITALKTGKELAEAKEPDAAEFELKFIPNEQGVLVARQVRKELGKDISTELQYALDVASEAMALQSRAKLTAPIIVPLKYASQIDIRDQSLVPINEAAGILRNILTPPDIEAGLGIQPGGALRAGAGGRGPDGQAKTVRVEINMNGEQMEPINVNSDKDADNLVKAIKRTNRTRGNFRTPFTKNG